MDVSSGLVILPKKSMGNISINQILSENDSRRKLLNAPYDPIIGDSRDDSRFCFSINGLSSSPLWLPKSMAGLDFIKDLMEAKSIDAYIRGKLKITATTDVRKDVRRSFMLMRCKYDFPFWAASFVKIKNKQGGPDIPFVLNFPQRKLVRFFESQRSSGIPIRAILLKARQWGGSTCVQFYMAWLQLIHKSGLNSLIIAHNRACAESIKNRLPDAILEYPSWMLENGFSKRPKSEKAFLRMILKERNCNIFVASADCPDSCRGIDLSLIHCSEVAFWKSSATASPERVVKAAFSGVVDSTDSMIVLESTANGRNNYFYREFHDASRGFSRFTPMFIPWFWIPYYECHIDDVEAFAHWLLKNRKKISTPPRTPSGAYLWSLWTKGATLEAIAWYVNQRRCFRYASQMTDEFPSSHDEAFRISGKAFVAKSAMRKLEKGCLTPTIRGDLFQSSDYVYDPYRSPGSGPLENLDFASSEHGEFKIWGQRELPEYGYHRKNRYLVVASPDTSDAEYHNVTVFDRLTGRQDISLKVVAQWNKRSDIDAFAWEAAKIAKFYDNAILTFVAPYLTEENGGNTGFTSIPEFTLSKISGCYSNFYEQPEDPYCLQIKLIKAKSVELVKKLASDIRRNAYIERDPEFPKVISETQLSHPHFDPRVLARATALSILPHLPLVRNVPIAQSARR